MGTGPKRQVRTFTGREIDVFNLQPEDICIEDIAHALACLNRFNGHTKKPISVAQHSIFVARMCEPEHQLQGLLHDGAEAYLGDINKWIKASMEMAHLLGLEISLQRDIYVHFGCHPITFQDVNRADEIMVRFEGMKGFGPEFWIDHPKYPKLTTEEIEQVGKWGYWSWQEAERLFLDHYRMYTEKD